MVSVEVLALLEAVPDNIEIITHSRGGYCYAV
jgi:hypothetical protein